MKASAVVIMMSLAGIAHAGGELGLIGGENATSGVVYAAFVGLDGTLTQLSGADFPPSGFINSVAINNSGVGLIGGEGNGSSAYASLVAPNGVVTQLTGAGLPATGQIFKVAINNSGTGLIGGEISNACYVASVASDGSLAPLSGGNLPSSGRIATVAINSSGVGLVGGAKTGGAGSGAYAALVSPGSNTLTQLTGSGLPGANGSIYSVAINDAGDGLVGGGNPIDASQNYLARVSPNSNILTPLSGGNFPVTGQILSVAMNQNGAGLVGGDSFISGSPLNTSPYAALVPPNSDTLVQLTGGNFPLNGSIFSVAINNAGAGLIGGYNNNGPVAYAALVAPDGTLTQLTGDSLSLNELIFSVAINDAGVGLIGGSGTPNMRVSSAYIALVAPNGTLTQLGGGNLPSNGYASVAMILDAVTPSSIGPYSSAMNTQLAASYALKTHLGMQGRFWTRERPSNEVALLADAGEELAMNFRSRRGKAPGEEPQECKQVLCAPKKPCEQAYQYTVWAEPFGDYIHQKAEGEIPSFTNQVAGILAAFDYRFAQFLVGGGLGYAYNYIHLSKGLGHSNLQEETAYVYGSYRQEHLWVNAALWGGLYQLHNDRHTMVSISSTSHTHGWILDPHIEVAAPFAISCNNAYSVEPFVMFDWVNSWQHSYTEKGTSGLNLVVDSQYASLLRSELGLRFYELFRYDWGKLLLTEALSYVNQAPFHFQKTNTLFVSSASTFPVATGGTNVQNLGGAELRASFLPCDPCYPYGAIDFQGEFGSSYQSYFASLEIGKRF